MSGATLTAPALRPACVDADPDLFFPEPGTPLEQVEQAKQICAGCPIRQSCLENAIRRGDQEAICGGLTAAERNQMLNGGSVVSMGQRRPGRATARQLAVKHGAYLVVCLGQYGMSVQQMAVELGSTEASVYRAYLLVVPPRAGHKRPKPTSVLENLVQDRAEQMLALNRRGFSQSEIGGMFGAPQSMVSAALFILRQRDQAVQRMSEAGVADPMEVLRSQEIRIRQEAGVGLSVDDVIQVAGEQILRMAGDGVPLRRVAQALNLNREAVRRAYQQMTVGTDRSLTQNEMEEAA
ncbi:WhiB family transcriptional regulator [Streptomyces sp. NPDC101117]|uniref:WhiB family transcriptional regulator n=1 Tax=Streptomyces sp. NPDC101117 TaxID=3366108 RepID=UPI0037FA8704